ncbi:MAG: protease modulator HflC [Victivallaceae bacterium]|nr:protease modulator HflC [Victivallaceae bacterium]
MNDNIFRHWPTVLLGVIVAAVLLLVVFSYQLAETESAVVTTMGSINKGNPTPGFHFRWPYPIQKIYRFDNRIRCFSGAEGKLEEMMTSDGQNILVGIFVDYRISDPKMFFTQLERIDEAEKQLNIWMRSAKSSTFGRYRFNQIINTDPKKMKLAEIQSGIRKELEKSTSGYGISISYVGISSINVPSSISEKVFDRMIRERKVVAEGYLAQGNTLAEEIRIKADREKEVVLADAEAAAKEVRALGDAEAARYYAVFKENPELAGFLRRLDSLRKIMKSRTTLVLDTNAAPFDLLKPGADTMVKGPVRK